MDHLKKNIQQQNKEMTDSIGREIDRMKEEEQRIRQKEDIINFFLILLYKEEYKNETN